MGDLPAPARCRRRRRRVGRGQRRRLSHEAEVDGELFGECADRHDGAEVAEDLVRAELARPPLDRVAAVAADVEAVPLGLEELRHLAVLRGDAVTGMRQADVVAAAAGAHVRLETESLEQAPGGQQVVDGRRRGEARLAVAAGEQRERLAVRPVRLEDPCWNGSSSRPANREQNVWKAPR